jgi:hypothetical protein
MDVQVLTGEQSLKRFLEKKKNHIKGKRLFIMEHSRVVLNIGRKVLKLFDWSRCC